MGKLGVHTVSSKRNAQIIASMMRENTGRAGLDSGDYYGRHWEANQKVKSFDAQPVATLEARHGISVTVNVYHFLKERATADYKWQTWFERFANSADNSDHNWFRNVEDFIDHIRAKGYEVSGFFGRDDGDKPLVGNTYNEENMLSQDFWYCMFEIDDEPMSVISLHNGCDARGGYTMPRWFRAGGPYDEYSILDWNKAEIACTPKQHPNFGAPVLPGMESDARKERPSHFWERGSYSSYQWHYTTPDCHAADDPQYEVEDASDLNDYESLEIETEEEWEAGKLCYIRKLDSERKDTYSERVLCPVCGGELQAYTTC